MIRTTHTGGAFSSDEVLRRLHVVAHELSGLIDGSLRLLELARRGLTADEQASGSDVARHLDGAHAAMSHVADLIRTAYRPGATSFHRQPERTLASAIVAAVEVLRPHAEAQKIAIDIVLDEELQSTPAGLIYGVVSNAVRNAIEAIGREGHVVIRAGLGASHDGTREVLLEVIDDGPGPPEGAGVRVFELGFTTKPESSGVGLALAREVVEEMGGTIELTTRRPQLPRRRGAVLRVRFPLGDAQTREEGRIAC